MIKTIKRLTFDILLKTGPQMQSFTLQTSYHRMVQKFTTVTETCQFLMFLTVNTPEMQVCMGRGEGGGHGEINSVKQNKL